MGITSVECFFKYLLRKQSETNFGQEEIEDGQKKKIGGNYSMGFALVFCHFKNV